MTGVRGWATLCYMNPFEHIPKEDTNPYNQSVEQQFKSLAVRKAELAEEIEDATEKSDGELVQKLKAELALVERDLVLTEAKL